MSALDFMRVYEMAKTKNFLDLNLPVSTLYLLARPNTPPKVIETVVERSEEGEQFTTVDIKRLIHEAKPPVFVPATAAPRMPDKSKPPVEVTRMITKPSPEPVMAADILTSCELMSVLPPKIGEDLAMRLRGHRATLFSWTQQHKDAGIPDVLAAFNAAIDAIDELLDYKRKETKMMIIALLFLSDTLFTLSWTYAAASDACIFRVRLSGRLGGGQRACDDHLSGQAGPGLNDQWNALDFVCRAEPGGSEASDLACEQRSALDKILEKKGCRNIYPATGLTIRLIGNAGR